MTRKIEISSRTIVFTVLFLIFIWFLYLIREIILVFFISLLIMTILNPTVTKLSQRKIPRGLSVLLVYILGLLVLLFAVVSIIPPLVEQSGNFANNLPKNLSNLGFSSIVSDQITQQVITEIGKLPAQIIKVGFSVFSNVLAIISVLIFAFYLLLARGKLDNQLSAFLDEKQKKDVIKIIDTLEYKLGGWARGELSLMFVVGLMSFLGLSLLGIPYALPLALLAGILEIVPNIGPVLSSIPAIILGFNISPIIGIAAAALFLLVQQVENYVFVPKIMEKSVGVSPIVTLLAISVGLKVAGVIGILIAVPVYITTEVIVKHYLSK